MKISLPILLVIAAVSASAQERYLVSPNQEVIRIGPGQSAGSVFSSRSNERASTGQGICSNKFYFGYWPSLYPVNANFGGWHSDVLGMWFEAKATGTIDTIFWYQWNDIGAADSTIFLRVHRSLIGPDYGPGVRPGPFAPPCQGWGYWMNSNDLDGGVAAFAEEATDTNWVSTIIGSPVPSTPHLGEELWGAGGYPIQVHPGLNFVPMDTLFGPIDVTAGDNFFVSFTIPPCQEAPSVCHEEWEIDPEGRTAWAAEQFLVTTADEDYPSRLWKFYKHDLIATNCNGSPDTGVLRGWVARGGFSSDTLAVAVLNIAYALTVYSNVPPYIATMSEIPGNQFAGGAGTVPISAIIEDCDPENPLNAGVDYAVLVHEIDGVPQPDIPMNDLGADYWKVMYPLPPAPATVTCRIRAVDLAGASTMTPPHSFSVVAFGERWYGIDTAIACTPRDISGTGSSVDTSEFFDPKSSGTVDKDGGIAGPFDLGGTVRLFNDEYRYAWISVDGAIGLGKTATDTVKIVGDSMWAQFLNVSPSISAPGIDVPVIAPLWAEQIVGDGSGQYGRILYGNDGDPCLFIVQWDSIGGYYYDVSQPDFTTFRVVVNRCTGVVEYQYESVGTLGLDSTALIGMQADPYATPGSRYLFVNERGYPLETRPTDGSCIRFYPRNPGPESDGWNLVSISVLPNDGDYSAVNLFPGGPVWEFDPHYNAIHDSLRPGRGYWMKNLDPGVDGAPGVFFDSVTVPVQDKWNIVGGLSWQVPTGSILATGGSVASNFFGYGSGGYYTASSFEPGQGYWVKMNGSGSLTLEGSAAIPKSLTDNGLSPAAGFARVTMLKLSDASGRSQSLYLAEDASPSLRMGSASTTDLSMFELPPPPPGNLFDARFSSGRMLESYRVDGATSDGIFPIAVGGGSHPVTIRWNVSGEPAVDIAPWLEVTREGVVRSYPMDNDGALTVDGAALLAVKVSSRKPEGLPSGFALSSNYPNPFNPSTTIEYTLPVESPVSVVVFNVAGEEVERLADGEKAAGFYTVRWDAAGFPSGVYYCRMTAGTYHAARKMLLLK